MLPRNKKDRSWANEDSAEIVPAAVQESQGEASGQTNSTVEEDVSGGPEDSALSDLEWMRGRIVITCVVSFNLRLFSHHVMCL